MVFAINSIVDTKLGKGKIVEIVRNKEDNNKKFVTFLYCGKQEQ